ncbi:hypothetical protein GCM10027614_54960 [Micromonospora vulcania]
MHRQLHTDSADGVGGVQVRVPGEGAVVGPGDQVHGRGLGVAQPEQDVLVERVRAVGVTRDRASASTSAISAGPSRPVRVTWSLVGSALLIPSP